jgi:hypothetical protein
MSKSKKEVLHDPIMYKERKVGFTFASPTKEKATTGRFMDAGADYGTGFTNPIGKFKASNEGPIPQESCCFEPGEAVH